MKKNKIINFILILVFLILCFGCKKLDINELSYDFCKKQSTSPEGSYTINLYESSSGEFSLYELVNNKTEEKRNIYLGYEELKYSIDWIDEEYVIINGRVLNVLTDTYDYREHR